ncbi:flippase [Algivirga pacifica]
MIVKVVGMSSALLISVFLGRTLGPEGLGVVNLANQLGMVCLVLTMFGFQFVIVKFISIAKSQENYQNILNTINSALFVNTTFAIIIAVLGWLLNPFLIKYLFQGRVELTVPILLTFFMLIPQTVARVFSAALNGYGKVWQSNLVEQTLSSILVLVGLAIYWVFSVEFSSISVLILYLVSRLIMVVVVKLLWHQQIRGKVSALKGSLNLRPMFKMGLPMLMVSGTSVIASNLDTMMLASLGTMEDVGLYNVAARLAFLTSFLLQVTNTAISPKLASMFHESKLDQMSKMVRKITLGLVVIALMVFLSFVLIGGWMLSFWGENFVEAQVILIILAVGQFFNIATGCSGLLLVMCGYEKEHGYISVLSLIMNVILNVLLIKSYGVIGVAVATAITVSLSNIFKVVMVKRKISISILPF